MKKLFLCAAMALACAIAPASLFAQTSTDINFLSSVPQSQTLTPALTKLLTQKIDQIIAANNAGAVTLSNAFVIEAALTIGDTYTSSVGVRPVTLQRGELSLTAKNRIDGSVYNSANVALESNVVGKGAAATEALVRSIKPTDKAFVRFIRNSRTRIAEYFEQNGLELPVYQDEQKEEKSEEAVADDTTIDNDLTIIDFPEMGQKKLPEPKVKEGGTTPSSGIATLEYEKNNWFIEIGWCYGYISSNCIRFEIKVTNLQNQKRRGSFVVDSGYMPTGAMTKEWRYLDQDNCSTTAYGVDFPSNIVVSRVVQLGPINEQFSELPLVEMSIDGMKLNIKNLPIQWM